MKVFNMDKRDIIDETEECQIKDFFKKIVFSDVYEAWADSFEIEIVNTNEVRICYEGTEDIKEFKKACKGPLFSAVYTVMGEGTKVKFLKKPKTETLTSNIKKNIKAFKFFVLGMIFVCIATSIIVVLCNYIGNRTFRETFYITSSIKVDSSVRVIQLSDLHSTKYGKDNKDLLKRVQALEPDIIICTGDIVDSAKDDVDYAVSLSKELSKIAPSYYIYGNNEVETIYDFMLNEKELDKKFGFDGTNRDESALLNIEDSFEERLESVGMKVLKNEKDTIKVRTMEIDVYGVLNSNPSSFWSYSGNAFVNYINENTDNLKITAVHEPFIFEEFQYDFWGDLLVSGHTHGGVVRVPMLGPLYTKEGGLFPERNGGFVYGRYNTSGSPLIVSSGLENSNVFRVNNQPELVVIDINKF